MAEKFPRWGLPDVNFVETDPAKIRGAIITGYEDASGRVLAQGDPVRLFLLTIAERIIHLQNCINATGQQNLLTYSQGSTLDALGVWLDVERLDASPAMTTLQFTLSQALTVPTAIKLGFQVTNGIVTFATDKELIIPAGKTSGEVSATCTVAGIAGNDYLIGQINTIVEPLPYLDKASNITVTAGGADIESDEHFAERIKTATDKFSVAGPIGAYRHHAVSVNNAIIDVSLYSPAPCEVEIYPLLADGELPTEDVLKQVQDYFSANDIVPFTDEVTVMAPITYEYKINVDYYININDVKKSTTIQAAVEKAVEEYRVWQQTKIGRAISPEELIYKVKDAGAEYVDLETLSPASYDELDVNEVAQCTGVTVTYRGTRR